MEQKIEYRAIIATIMIAIFLGISILFFREKAFIVTSMLLMCFIIIKNFSIIDLSLYSYISIFFFAQFQTSTIYFLRWIFLALIIPISIYTIKGIRPIFNRIAFGLCIIAVYAIATSPLSHFPLISALKGISIILLALVIFLVYPAINQIYPALKSKKYFILLLLRFAIAIIIANAVYTLFYPFSSIDPFSRASFLDGRFRGMFMNPNGIGTMYGIFFLPILFNEIKICKKKYQRRGLVFIFILAIIQLVLTQSRAGISSGIISLSILFLGNKNRLKYFIILFVGLLVVIALNLYSEDSILKSAIYRNEESFSGSGRFSVWIEMWKSFKEKPFFGSGLGVADTGIEERGLVFTTAAYSIEKSNSFLAILQELGVVGFFIFCAVILIPLIKICLQRIIHSIRFKNANGIVIVSITFAGLFNTCFEAWLLSVGSIECLFFWLFASLLFSSIKNKNDY